MRGLIGEGTDKREGWQERGLSGEVADRR